MSEILQKRVFSEQVRLLYRGMIRSVSLNYVAILLISLMMYDKAPLAPLIVWLVLVFFVTSIRLKSAVIGSPYNALFPDPQKKLYEFVAGSATQGLVWGLGLAYFILFLPLAYQAMLFILLTVTVAISMISYASSRLAYFAYLITCTLLPIISVIVYEEGIQVTLAYIMIVVLMLLSNSYIWNYNRLKKGLIFRYQNEELLKSLTKSNKKLEQSNKHLERLKYQLTAASLTDELTGISNRRHFNGQLNNEWLRAMRDARQVSCIMIDVDHFKKYNDEYGHLKGDECLQTVARAIKGQLKRPADVAARYGGEEFVVLLPDTSLEGALLIAERIEQKVRELEISHSLSRTGILSVSQGVACLIPKQGENEKLLINMADQALYEAKAEGRDQIKAAAVDD